MAIGAVVFGIEGGEVMAFLQLTMIGGLPYTAICDAAFTRATLSGSLNKNFGYLEGY